MGVAEPVDHEKPVVQAGVGGDRPAGVVAAVGDVELVGVEFVHPLFSCLVPPRCVPFSLVVDAQPGGEWPVAGQQRQRGQRVGGPAEHPLEPMRDVLGDLYRHPEAGQVGVVLAGDVAEVDVGDLALGQDTQRPGR